MSNEKIGVFVVERQELIREGLLALLAREPDVEVMGASYDGDDALGRIPLLRVDVVLLDISVVHKNGTNIFRELSQTCPGSKIIALANHSGEACVRTTLTLGVAGYVLKNDSHAELMIGIRSVMQGNIYLSPSVSQLVLSKYLGQHVSNTDRRTGNLNRRNSRQDRRANNRASGAADALTYRERQIVKLIAEGRKNKEIAKLLSISSKTVEKHRANSMKKLGCHSTAQLTVFALENGIMVAEFAPPLLAQWHPAGLRE